MARVEGSIKSIDAAVLLQKLKRVVALLEDPHPGLMTWNVSFGNAIAEASSACIDGQLHGVDNIQEKP